MSRLIALFTLLLATIVLNGCAMYATYRYRLTVEVLFGGEVRTGTGVLEERTNSPGIDKDRGYELQGEAVWVDLGGGSHVILAIDETTKVYLGEIERAYVRAKLIPMKIDCPSQEDSICRLRLATKIDASVDIYPYSQRMERWTPHLHFVRFRDPNDPLSVEEVPADDFAAVFGGDTRLVRVTVQATKEPLTTGIERKLPWLARLDCMKAIDGTRGSGLPDGPLHAKLFCSSFKRRK